MTRRSITVFAACAALLTLPPALAGGARAQSTATFNCAAAFNPYQISAGQAQECGDSLHPLQGTQHLADGGSEYDYSVNGHTIRFRVPPTGFDPLKATSERLTLYGLPPRPASSSPSFRDWEQAVTHIKHYDVPGPYLITAPHVRFGVLTHPHWSGDIANQASGASPFNSIQGQYAEPAPSAVCASSAAEGVWVGIGGKNSGNLGQDGTAYNTPGVGNHQGWFLDLADMSGPGLFKWTANPGDTIIAQVQYYQGAYYFWAEDYTTGIADSAQIASTNYDGSTAEFIVERPKESDPITWTEINEPLADFGNLYWSQAVTNGNSLGVFPYDSVNMVYNSTTLAMTDTGLTNNQNFTDHWQQCI